MPIGSRTTFDITLANSSIEVEQVVVTALGIKRAEKALSYNVQQVNSDAITANKDAKARLGVWFPNRITAKKATVTIGETATPVEKAGLLTNDFLLLRELELKKGEKAVVEMK